MVKILMGKEDYDKLMMELSEAKVPDGIILTVDGRKYTLTVHLSQESLFMGALEKIMRGGQ